MEAPPPQTIPKKETQLKTAAIELCNGAHWLFKYLTAKMFGSKILRQICIFIRNAKCLVYLAEAPLCTQH